MSANDAIATALGFVRRVHPRPVGFAVLAAIPPKNTDGTSGGPVEHCYLNLQRGDQWPAVAERFIVRYVPTHNLYIAPATYAAATQRTEANVIGVWWLYRESDDVPLPAWFPAPTITVRTSAGRFHHWWQLTAPLTVPDAKRYLTAIADTSAISHAAVDAARLLRLPGTVNHNRGGERVALVEDTGEVFDRDAFAPILAQAPAPYQRHRAGESDAPIHPGGRRPALLSLAGAMRRHGANADEIAHVLTSFNERRCVPPLEDGEVQDLARDIAARYAEDRPPVRTGDAVRDRAGVPPKPAAKTRARAAQADRVRY